MVVDNAVQGDLEIQGNVYINNVGDGGGLDLPGGTGSSGGYNGYYGGTGAGTFTQNGIVYGNAANALQVTGAANMSTPGSAPDVAESYQILTVTSGGDPVWTNTIDGGTF